MLGRAERSISAARKGRAFRRAGLTAKAHAELYATLRADGGAHRLVDRMQTRAELYDTISYFDYEALDSSIIKTIVPQGMPQRAALK